MPFIEVPSEFEGEIYENLVQAAHRGHPIRERLVQWALHSYIWERALLSQDFLKAKEKFREEGSLFLIGHGLARVTTAIFDEGDAPPPIDVILFWLPLNMLRGDTDKVTRVRLDGDLKHPQINLLLLNPRSRDFQVEVLAKYLKKDSSGFKTNITYLHDAGWKIHTVDVEQKTVGINPTRHGYEIEILPVSGRRETIRLWEKSGDSLPLTKRKINSLGDKDGPVTKRQK